MKAVVQRVSSAKVIINNNIYSQINNGLLVLVGISTLDSEKEVAWLSSKIIQMRIFNDSDGKMNKSLVDIAGELLLVSQFTLYANTQKGNRPSFMEAARPELAIPLYEKLIKKITTDLQKPIKTGLFGADMKVELINDGPVTIVLESPVLN